MYIPEYLYFEPKKLSVQHTTQYTGNLDVPVALESNPRCWIKEDITGSKQKKTIVISDFRLEKLSDVDAAQFKRLIDSLLAEGFTIYLWQEKGPIELSQTDKRKILQCALDSAAPLSLLSSLFCYPLTHLCHYYLYS